MRSIPCCHLSKRETLLTALFITLVNFWGHKVCFCTNFLFELLNAHLLFQTSSQEQIGSRNIEMFLKLNSCRHFIPIHILCSAVNKHSSFFRKNRLKFNKLKITMMYRNDFPQNFRSSFEHLFSGDKFNRLSKLLTNIQWRIFAINTYTNNISNEVKWSATMNYGKLWDILS